MDINRLLKKRQLNVQEQNAVVAYKIAKTACTWRERDIPVCLVEYAESQGVDWTDTIVLKLEIDFSGMPCLFGLLLTQTERFIAFELDTDIAHRKLQAVDRWEDISDQQDYSVSKKGIGKGFGAIALEVRRQMLSLPQDSAFSLTT
ncbi:hypothetical protein K5D43_14770 [Pseudomonas cichorii]|uniref:Uncharacterized protein n=1 Tax=Pseudomonas lijiangensis TaxID=2995658 RepID=A0ABX8HYA6_9PSED|nr:hypothetical protein [Pseudomonas lijiangensis]MBX8505145.1 hypothetical protein [Pseudomonas lijiangensis]MBX8555749.1 hypothetical protein [Pseudomonas cichorii]QWU85577.1 hypothetical protein KQP88_07055 [Pseudomonas lijiangensis]